MKLINEIIICFDKNIGSYFEALCTIIPIAALLSISDMLLGADHLFLMIIFISVFIDAVLGIFKHAKQKTLSANEFIIGQVIKLAIAYINIFIFHSIAYSVKETGFINTYIINSGNLSSLLYVVSSIFSSIYVISNKKFPPQYILDKIDSFFKTGKLDINNNN
jgi:hypothetical protein